MTNNKQQTAVDIAFEKLANQGLLITRDYKNLVAYREAKVMEKEQAIKLYYEYELYAMMNESDVMTFGQFYKQTFGGGEQ